MKKLYPILFTAYCVMCCTVCAAQDKIANEKPAMATEMRANGKIYVVVAVVVTILLGVVAYLFSLDRKISRLENENTGPEMKKDAF